MSTLDKLIAAFLSFMFLFAGVDKILHLEGFINAINDYSILPIPLGKQLAPLIISAELAIAIGLLHNSWRRIAARQSAILMSIFTVALVANQIFGQKGLCGCWFSVNMAQGDIHLVLNIILVALSLSLWYSSPAPGKEQALEGGLTEDHTLEAS